MPAAERSIDAHDVRRFIAERSFTTDAERIGVEIEWLTYPIADPTSHVPFDDLRAAVARAEPRSTVTYEPGGQLELSTAPARTVVEACSAIDADVRALVPRLRDAGIALHGIGLEPQRGHNRVLHTPRYAAMERYFDAGGPAGRRMMCRTAAVQLNLDAGAQPDVLWRAAHTLGPVIAAAFANSPFLEGRAAPWRSARLATWWAMDRTRTAPVADDDSAIEAWQRYVLDANVMMIRAGEDRFEPVMETLPFERWIREGSRLGYPSIEDLEYHLTTLFPPIRPRGWVEIRMIDALPDPWWRVAIAVPVALLYDAEARERAVDASHAARDRWLQAFAEGPHDAVLRGAVRACFEAAIDALPRVGADRATIAATHAFAERYAFAGRCPADDLLDAYASHGTLPPFDTMPAFAHR